MGAPYCFDYGDYGENFYIREIIDEVMEIRGHKSEDNSENVKMT